MIAIDFQGGAHGNFLEFVCNMVAGIPTNKSPFNDHGAAHNKQYFSNKVFIAGHYSFKSLPMTTNKVIAVKIANDDLLPLSQISLLRAGDYGYDNNILEIDTFNKLNNENYRWVLDNLIQSFFTNQIKNSYDNVKDVTWPSVETLEEFNNLPEHIKTECLDIHNLKLFELNEMHPDCPREILREFFEHGFLNPTGHGFVVQQSKMVYPPEVSAYEFPFHTFYNTDLFIDQLKQIAAWAQLEYNEWQPIVELHQQFLQRQPYKDSKNKCDIIVDNIIKGATAPKVNLLEEAYINAMLRKNGYERRY